MAISVETKKARIFGKIPVWLKVRYRIGPFRQKVQIFYVQCKHFEVLTLVLRLQWLTPMGKPSPEGMVVKNSFDENAHEVF